MAVGDSRSELLRWLNETLQLQYTKVEQCGTGAVYCQLMDCIYGGVALGKVKFASKISDYDATNNMKILQASFNRNDINKHIQVERLIKCRLQDNLELLQWFKRHWVENKDHSVPYDAIGRRNNPVSAGSSRRATINGQNRSFSNETPSSGPGASFSASNDQAIGGTPHSRTTSTPIAGRTTSTGSRTTSTGSRTTPIGSRTTPIGSRTTPIGSRNSSIGSKASATPTGTRVSTIVRSTNRALGTRSNGGVSEAVEPMPRRRVASSSLPLGSKTTENLELQLDEKTAQIELLNENLLTCQQLADSLEIERNFYFNKLRDIEILMENLQIHSRNDDPLDPAHQQFQKLSIIDVTSQVQEILYMTEQGFEVQNETEF